MPIHDWTRVDSGLFHAFHQGWIISLSAALNDGRLPEGYFALPEQNINGPVPDVLTLRSPGRSKGPSDIQGGLAVATAPPRTRVVRRTNNERRSEDSRYARKADRLVVRKHRHGEIVAVVEIVSPGNKGSKEEFRTFVYKATDLILRGVHLLVIDLFPPGKRDPHGIHKAIWDGFVKEDFEVPPDKPLTLASYAAGTERVAYVESVGPGDALPDMPLFLDPDTYVPVPLDATYQAAWAVFPGPLKGLLEGE